MNIKEIENAIFKIWESTITDIKIDVLAYTIVIKLKLPFNYNERCSELVFEGVSAYYFFNATKKRRKRFIEYDGNRVELTSINIVEGDCEIKLNADEKWLEQYGGGATFSLEIWDNLLLIEAARVIVDGKAFDLD